MSMAKFEAPAVSARSHQEPRVVAVVDGADRSWRSLAWAVGYARARGSTSIEIIPFLRSWERLLNAAQTTHFTGTVPRVDYGAVRRDIVDTAGSICFDGGIDPHVMNGDVCNSRDLRWMIRDRRPDFVVVGRPGGLTWISAKRTVSTLTKNGIPVIVIP
jgi:hypothetical protein